MDENRRNVHPEIGGIAIAGMGIASATIAIALPILGGTGRELTSPTQVILTTVAVFLATASSIVAAITILNRTRFRDSRIAMTGTPGVGKTVFSITLFDALMNNPQAHFTAESKTILSVHQAIRGISQGEWPRSTPTEVVRRYEGRLGFGSGRSVIDLELGDSAGEYWAEISANGSRDADFLAYVMSADGIAHVIPADSLAADTHSIEQDVQDLKMAARLTRSAYPRRRHQSLLIVVSKMDLSLMDAEDEAEIRFKVFRPRPELFDLLNHAVGAMSASALLDAIDSLSNEYRDIGVTFSSTASRPMGQDFSEDVSLWIRESAYARARDQRRSAILQGIGIRLNPHTR